MSDTITRNSAPGIPKTPAGFTRAWVAAALSAGGCGGCRIEAVKAERIDAAFKDLSLEALLD